MPEASANALLREKEKFEALFEYASLGILVANQNGKIELVNGYILNQFGYQNKSDLIGQEVEILIPSRYEHTHHNHRANYLKKPERRPMGVGRDLYATKKDGSEFPVEVSLSHYISGGETFVIAFLIDITKRKETETAIILQKEQLAENNLKIEELNESLEKKVALRTQQLQETMTQLQNSKEGLTKALSKEKELGDLKSRFVSMASHEFRTPLSTILSSASLLAKYTETSEQEKRGKHIDRIKSSVNNLTDILNEFLSIGKMEDGKIIAKHAVFNLEVFITEILNEICNISKEHQRLAYKHTGSATIVSDSSLLRNIIFNLLSNAIKFSSNNGLIDIHSHSDKNKFTITVKDNGIGISKEDQQHLFERFFRASNATNIQGTGLGLHIVAKYAELLEGDINFVSGLEKGTTFTLSFKNQTRI
ncbi:MAG: PAS domain-containing sensor histidine kinase [Ferruginibacter sp.]